MRRVSVPWVLATTLLGATAWAEDPAGIPSIEQATSEVSRARVEPEQRAIRDEVIAIKPQLGTMAFRSPVDNSSQYRAIYGLTLDWNWKHALFKSTPTRWFVGSSLGALYSHVGTGNADFFGTGDGTEQNTGGGANVLLVPANLKIGYNLSDSFRLAVHGGGNIIYRSVTEAMNLSGDAGQSGSSWNIYPNVGGDVEIGVSSKLALLIRPDVTLTPEKDIFTGTFGLSASLG